MILGSIRHARAVGKRYGTHRISWLRENVDPTTHYIHGKPKHKYLFPLDEHIKNKIKSLAKPYPKKRARSIDGDATIINQIEEGGSNPTLALNNKVA
jgi:hypothetical protein